jgi:hypothetical protein
MLVFLLAISGCGGGDEKSPAEVTSEFALATAINYPYEANNTRISDSGVDLYSIKNTKKEFDYYIRLNSLVSNPANTNIKLEVYSGDIKLASYNVLTGYDSVIQVKNLTSDQLNFKIISPNKSTAYLYNIKVFQGLEEGLMHDATTYEHNDFSEISFPISYNQTCTSSVKSVDDPYDWYVIDQNTTIGDYYFEIIASDSNPTGITQENLYYEFYDENGKIGSSLTTYTGIGYTNQVNTTKNGKLYALIYRPAGGLGELDRYNNSNPYRYSIKAYPGLSNGLVQDSTTYEPNNFKEISYAIDTNQTYASEVHGFYTGHSTPSQAGYLDREDWFELKNADKNTTYRDCSKFCVSI